MLLRASSKWFGFASGLLVSHSGCVRALSSRVVGLRDSNVSIRVSSSARSLDRVRALDGLGTAEGMATLQLDEAESTLKRNTQQ